MNDKKDIELNNKSVEILMRRIIILEKTNLKTRELSYSQIVKKIKKYIEEEVECY